MKHKDLRDFLFRGLLFESEATEFQKAGIKVGADQTETEQQLLAEALTPFPVTLRNNALEMARLYSVLFAFEGTWIFAVVLFIYFFSNFIPLFYLKVNIDNIFIPIKADHASEEKIKLIYNKYKISKREKEIVQQICQGKTNQQIADELFISLQTVKDHTHRIYSKIGINSRMNLVQMVNG